MDRVSSGRSRFFAGLLLQKSSIEEQHGSDITDLLLKIGKAGVWHPRCESAGPPAPDPSARESLTKGRMAEDEGEYLYTCICCGRDLSGS